MSTQQFLFLPTLLRLVEALVYAMMWNIILLPSEDFLKCVEDFATDHLLQKLA